MTKKNKPKNEAQTENQETEKVQKEADNGSYGAGLVVVNTLILAVFAIIALVVANNNGIFDKYEKSENVANASNYTENEIHKIEDLITPHISNQAKIHILYGDETGGAHYHTVKMPCKSIFPESWSPSKIIKITEKIAANDNLEWKAQKNGNMFAQIMEDDILVRVVMDAERKMVKTSYPLNAGRTPCPKEENKTTSTPTKETEYFKVLDNVDSKSKKNFNQ